MFRPINRIPPTVFGRRGVSYSLPAIPSLDTARIAATGFPGLYSHKSLKELWYTRGQFLVDRLNSLLEEHNIKDAPADLNQLITLTFNKPELHGIYTHASMLHNLQFTLETLKPSDGSVTSASEADLLKTPDVFAPIENAPTDDKLKTWLVDSFGSIPEFRTLLLNSAKAIKGDGITWVVAQATRLDSGIEPAHDLSYKTLSVMNTYNAGIVDDALRSGQVYRMKQQKEAKLASLKKKEGEEVPETPDYPSDLVLGTVEEAEHATVFSDRKLLPILAIDASLRNYLLDYGVFGKQQYLDNVWRSIDWDVVAKRLPPRFRSTVELL